MASEWMTMYTPRLKPSKTIPSQILFWMPFILILCGLLWLSKDNADKKAIALLDGSTSSSSNSSQSDYNISDSVISPIPPNVNIVYFGNSILFVNDCPSVIHEMILTATKNEGTVEKSSCLIGGATIASLWSKQCNNILKNFVSSYSDGKNRGAKVSLHGSHNWDYMILQDQTQAPAREWSRAVSADSLRRKYGPLLMLRNQTSSSEKSYTVPIIVQTAAYRKPGVMNSDDLGDFFQFTKLLAEGAKKYAKTLNQVILDNFRSGTGVTNGTASSKQKGIHSKKNAKFLKKYGARVAPVGEGYRLLHDKNPTLFQKLYGNDHYHPSTYGTWLQACIIFITCFRQVPPNFDESWLHGISTEDASTLRSAACEVTGLSCQ